MKTFARGAGLILVGSALLLALAGGAAGQPPKLWQPEIRREGVGPRREALNAMELKPVADDLWSKVTGWADGAAPTPDQTKGKVVLIVTWAAWHPPSAAAVARADALLSEKKDKGLVVIAVHDQRKYDLATKMVKERGWKVQLGQDDAGKFRKALDADIDPNFYVVDRGGNMRFADIESDVVDRAVDLLLAETPEAAAGVPAQFQAAVKGYKGPSVKVRDVGGGAATEAFTPPTSEKYDAAPWPPKNAGRDDGSQSVPGTDLQGQRLPDADNFGRDNRWFTGKVPTQGRVVVVSFWSPRNAEWRRAQGNLRDAHVKHIDDVVVVGVARNDERAADTERAVRDNPIGYPQMLDVQGNGLYKAFNPGEGEQLKPLVAIVSTDGVVRWQGLPSDAKFRSALEQIIKADPGVAQRRAAAGR